MPVCATPMDSSATGVQSSSPSMHSTTLNSMFLSPSMSEYLLIQVLLWAFPAEFTHVIPLSTARSKLRRGLFSRGDVPSPGPSNLHDNDWLMTSTPSETIQSTASRRSPRVFGFAIYSDTSGAISTSASTTAVP